MKIELHPDPLQIILNVLSRYVLFIYSFLSALDSSAFFAMICVLQKKIFRRICEKGGVT